MSFTKTAVAAALAISMASTPVLAQSAAPLSVAASVDRSGAQVGHANQLFGDYGIPVAVFIAVIIGIVLLGRGNNNNDLPASA